MNKNKRNSKKVLAAICAFSGAFGGNSGASAALKNKKVPTVKTDVKSNVKSKNLSLNRQSGNKNFFGKAWDLIKANPIKSSLIIAAAAAGVGAGVGVPLAIAKSKGKKDKEPGNPKDVKDNQRPGQSSGVQDQNLKNEQNQEDEKQNQGENQETTEEIKIEEIEEKQVKDQVEDQKIKIEIINNQKDQEIKKIEINNQQPKDNFRFHFDNLKVNGKDANNNNKDVWSVLTKARIKASDPFKIYNIAENTYAVCIKDSSDTKDKLKSVDKTFLTSGPNKEKISDFYILCIKDTAFLGTSLNIVDPKVHFSFSILGTDNLGIKVNQ